MTCAILATALTATASLAQAQEVIRHPIPNSDFPIARAVDVPSDLTTVYLSGTVPAKADETAPADSVAAYGDTETQTVSILTRIEGTLADLGLDMGDVVKMQVFLVAPEGHPGMDFGGFMNGYTQFFGTAEQPNLPVRSVVEVAGLANPGWLAEIEVTAVRPAAAD